MLTKSGAKLMDFGLAKPTQAGLPTECRTAGHHLVQYTAKREDVGTCVGVLSFQLFRRHIWERAHDRALASRPRYQYCVLVALATATVIAVAAVLYLLWTNKQARSVDITKFVLQLPPIPPAPSGA